MAARPQRCQLLGIHGLLWPRTGEQISVAGCQDEASPSNSRCRSVRIPGVALRTPHPATPCDAAQTAQPKPVPTTAAFPRMQRREGWPQPQSNAFVLQPSCLQALNHLAVVAHNERLPSSSRNEAVGAVKLILALSLHCMSASKISTTNALIEPTRRGVCAEQARHAAQWPRYPLLSPVALPVACGLTR
jgi:hypothetical protein